MAGVDGVRCFGNAKPGSEEFANLRASLGIDISDAQLLDGWWNSILVGEMPGVSELLAKAARSFPLYAAS
jgi:glucose-1-phosphatase